MKGKLNTMQWIAVSMIAVGVILFCISFYLPPAGVIDPSVIKAFGEILGAVGLMMAWDTLRAAIDKGIDTTVKHNGTEIEVHNPDNKDE